MHRWADTGRRTPTRCCQRESFRQTLPRLPRAPTSGAHLPRLWSQGFAHDTGPWRCLRTLLRPGHRHPALPPALGSEGHSQEARAGNLPRAAWLALQDHPPQSQGTRAEPPCSPPRVLWPRLPVWPQSGLPQGIWPCSQFSWWWNWTKPSPARGLTLLSRTHPSPGGPRSCLPFWDLPTLAWRSPAVWGNVPTFSLYVTEADIEEGLSCPRKDRTSFLPSSLLMEVSCTLSSRHHTSGVGCSFGPRCSSLGSTKAFTKPASP